MPSDKDDKEHFINHLMANLTLEEKIAQMLQAEEKYITPEEVTEYGIGSILSGGGSHPNHYDDDVSVWYEMVKDYQEAALEARCSIPLLYGTDAVHGHNNVYGATIFPHNINLGMMNDAALVEQIGEATALEMKATGIHWNFSPAVSVARDIRWGRTYESFSEDPSIHANLVASFIQGLQSHHAIATAKHFVADGGTFKGIDQGDAILSEQAVRDYHLPPFIEAIEAGVSIIMVSFSSINGVKMHASEYWLTTVLRDELGFNGVLLSDWNAIFQLDGTFQEQLVTSINAGVDIVMLPMDWQAAHAELIDAVNLGMLTTERVDEAVKRILTLKYNHHLFENPTHRVDTETYFASDSHIELAKKAASASMVLLENDGVLPLNGTENLYLTGPAHDHVGYLAGGWTTHWQGNQDARLGTGTSILEGIQNHLKNNPGHIVHNLEDADTVIVVFSETPYAEGHGDTEHPTLFNGLAHPDNTQAYQQAIQAKALGLNVIGVIVSGRPLVLDDTVETFDALIAAFLPGSEGGSAFSDLLYNQTEFQGKLSFAWPASLNYFDSPDNHVHYPLGYGLTYDD